MPLAPLHPDEPALHHELRDALNAGLHNTEFFVWINVTPSGQAQSFGRLDDLVVSAAKWLSSLDPDSVSAQEEAPELHYTAEAGRARLRALPKKPEARGRSGQIVGNPEPVLAGWT